MDKLHHFVYASWITLIGARVNIFLGIILALMFSIGKEWHDNNQEGNRWDWWDFAADVEGIIFSLILLKI